MFDQSQHWGKSFSKQEVGQETQRALAGSISVILSCL